jgi:hypothetical protein
MNMALAVLYVLLCCCRYDLEATTNKTRTLDPFVTELCGITQQQVNQAPLLADVLQQHHAWLQGHGVLQEGVSCVPVTWTGWDLKVGGGVACGPAVAVVCWALCELHRGVQQVARRSLHDPG